jgi:hypothetical protein
MAINSSAQVTVFSEGTEDEEIIWGDGTEVISKSDIQAKQAELKADYDSKQYQRDRKAEYDKLNQFEMQFDDQRDGTTTWVDAINGIKDKYPKD